MSNEISAKTVFFSLIRAALTGESLDAPLDERVLRSIIKMGGIQGVLPLLFAGAKLCGCGEAAVAALQAASDRDLFDFVLREKTLAATRGALDGANLAYVPLKGAVICDLYPEKWMRTSNDIDLLVGEDELERAIAAVEAKTALRVQSRNFHDVAMTDGGVCLELHFSICEKSPALDPVLSTVWDHCAPSGEGTMRLMSAAFLAFHTVAHMSYHLASAGLGVRPYIDLWLLRRDGAFDEEFVRASCAKCGILKFYEAAALLGDVWFGDARHTPTTKDMERLCFHGGVFGSTRGAEAAMRREDSGAYLRKRVFQPKSALAEAYPEVERRPYLTPYYQVKRWGSALRRQKVKKTLRAIRETSPEQTAALDRVIRALELEV